MTWTATSFSVILRLRLTNQPGYMCVPGSRSSTGARSPYRLAPGPSRCLPGGLFVSPPRRSQADAARAASPPRPARAAQPYRPLCSRAGRSIADGDMVGLRLMNQPGPCAGRLAFVSARDAQTARAWPWPVSAWWTPVRSPPGRSQADAARVASPPYPARAAQTVYMVWVSTSLARCRSASAATQWNSARRRCSFTSPTPRRTERSCASAAW